ncbi:MAG: HIT domain-containing protein [Candidatus Pacearchaeota archaeon]
MLTKEQTETIKKQLIEHIKKVFPDEKKDFAIQKIESMTPEELEEFLKNNNLILSNFSDTKCIFCSIVKGDIDSYKIEENEEMIAVLELNPISKGHTIIIPKIHTSNFEKESKKDTKEIINSISKLIKKKLKPKEIVIINSNLFGHEIINIIPNYSEKDNLISLESKRYKASSEELLELKKILGKKSEKVIEKKEKTKILKPKKIRLNAEKIWLPKRIP